MVHTVLRQAEGSHPYCFCVCFCHMGVFRSSFNTTYCIKMCPTMIALHIFRNSFSIGSPDLITVAAQIFSPQTYGNGANGNAYEESREESKTKKIYIIGGGRKGGRKEGREGEGALRENNASEREREQVCARICMCVCACACACVRVDRFILCFVGWKF